MDLIKTVRVYMAEREIKTQTRLAEITGLHPNTIHMMLNGKQEIFPHAAIFASAFGVSTSEFIARAEEYSRTEPAAVER